MSLRLVWLAERHLDYKVEFTDCEMILEAIGVALVHLGFVRFVETHIPFRVVLEARVLAQESEVDRSGGTVTLFLDDDLRLTLHILVVSVIKLFSVNEHDHVCILFN